jgi:hypothetical protein
MSTNRKNRGILEDVKINVKFRLSALWLTLMLIYIYVDIFMFYKPGIIEDILAGKVWAFEISQAWGVMALVLMLIPIFMIYLSLTLKSAAIRWTNIIVGILYIAVGIGTTVGETWIAYIVGHTLGILVLALILWTAIKWPRQED